MIFNIKYEILFFDEAGNQVVGQADYDYGPQGGPKSVNLQAGNKSRGQKQ